MRHVNPYGRFKCEIIGNFQENPELVDNNNKEGQ